MLPTAWKTMIQTYFQVLQNVSKYVVKDNSIETI
jgi:hypothetical protein